MTTSSATAAKVPVTMPRCVVPFPDGSPCLVLPASSLGLCAGHLREAAAEHARLNGMPSQADRSPASIPFAALCRRCGQPGHTPDTCDA